jgi:O-antigen ligase
MMDFIIPKVLFLYIISLYLFAFSPDFYMISNEIAAAFIFLVVIETLAHKKRIKSNSFLLCFFLFVIMCALSYFVAIDQALVLIKVKTMVLNLIMAAALINYLDDIKKIKSLARAFVYSGFMASVYILITSDISQMDRMGSVLGNENAMGIIIGISFIICFYFIFYEKKYLYIPYSLVMLPTILLTGSRKAILLVVVAVILILFFENRHSAKKMIKFIILALAILLASYYLIFNVPAFYMILGRRVESLFGYLLGEGTREGSVVVRNYMIRFGLEMFWKRPLLGYGINNYRVLLAVYNNMYTYAHNNYVELLVGTGIAGTAAYYSICGNVLLGLKRTISHSKLGYILLAINLSILLLGFGMVHYDHKHLLIILAMGSCFTEVYNNTDTGACL